MISPAIFVLGALGCLGGRAAAASNLTIEGINTNNIQTFDCPASTRAHMSQSQLQAAMDRFAYLFYVKKDVEAAFNQYVATNYVQHNPNILDGRDAAIEALVPLFGSNATSFEVARVMVGVEYSTIHIKASTEGQASWNVFDVYKTIGSCVVEHWDCLQEIQNDTVSTHPYF